ncbi:hypothetical protein [Brevundimonas sp.]|uniref:hypothetical protein n=1 Tax=Brevundimonas sp. TaxID=1871086 RepID=UPI00272F731E|nr:hypothetical protein [Brevundimonas sp.]MDP1912037.1 hypothetical protein [Brevundimonas sp.]
MEQLHRLAALLKERNRLDGDIARAIGRPALPGHIGEFIASVLFDIELMPSATARFRSGPLMGRSVNVKLYGKREGLLDIAAVRPDYYLVLTGPRTAAASSRNQTRPIVIDSVFLFERDALLAELTKTGVKVGVATSVRSAAWENSRVWPPPGSPLLPITDEQAGALAALSSPT